MGGEGLNQWFNVTLCEGRNREVRRLWESLDVQVSRLMRVRYGDIKLEKTLPRGGWVELQLPQVNYLRKLVGLPPEERSKVFAVDDRKSQFKQAAQIRRAVRRHRERVVLQGDTETNVETVAPATVRPRYNVQHRPLRVNVMMLRAGKMPVSVCMTMRHVKRLVRQVIVSGLAAVRVIKQVAKLIQA